MSLVLIHLALAIALFLIVNWIGSHSAHAGYVRMSVLAKADEAPAFNFLYRSFSPVAYITVVSAVFYKIEQDWIVQDIYLVVIYYFVFRLLFNLLTGRGMLLNWVTQCAYVLISVPMSYYVYDVLIIHKDFLFPTAKELGSAVWLAIVAYAYHTFNSVKLSDGRTKARKMNYLQKRYKIYRRTYGEIIEEIAETKRQEALIYAILIVEAFNRPKLYRLVENILFYFGLAKTLGVMQVTTEKFITDYESVRLGAQKIVGDHLKAKLIVDGRRYPGGQWAVRREVIELYNPDSDYISEVDGLYEEILDQFYPEEKTDWYAEMEAAHISDHTEHDASASRQRGASETVTSI
ncbi:hypothetical protein [Microbulbifer agarilyticus]|uniref:hypothetical protein n=1 Tax=Microbulbifer agarilyticus TaxID=260552 RepID=UPI0018DD9957|nr:hypothetical protein [Microbulbifer agarilyticus]